MFFFAYPLNLPSNCNENIFYQFYIKYLNTSIFKMTLYHYYFSYIERKDWLLQQIKWYAAAANF